MLSSFSSIVKKTITFISQVWGGGQDIFARKYMHEKLTKCTNFTWYMPEKLTKCSNFTWFLTEKYFPNFFFWGGGNCPSLPPVSYAYDHSSYAKKINRMTDSCKKERQRSKTLSSLCATVIGDVVLKLGYTSVILLELAVKVDGTYYCHLLMSQPLLPAIRHVSSDFIF